MSTPAAAPEIRLVPLAEIDEAAIPRDRTGLDPAPQTELELSITASGLRQPIELFPLAEPRPPHAYGLISGYRRLLAFRTLHERTGAPRFAAIPAFLRPAASPAATFAAMVEENEIRAGLSPFERGLVAVTARNQGLFASIEEAVDALYPNADRHKRARLRSLAFAAEELHGTLAAPERLSQAQALRLARAFSAGFGDVIRAALEDAPADHATQWDLLEPVLTEADANIRRPETSSRPGRPRRVLRPRYGLCIRRERTQTGWCLHFTGREASGALMDLVLDEIEKMYEPS